MTVQDTDTMRNFNIPSFRDRGNSTLASPHGKGSFHDDNSSQVSDMSYTSTADGSWVKRLSTTFGVSDPLVDDAIGGIYGDPVRINTEVVGSLLYYMTSYCLALI